jgi:hypothetical protein
VKGTVQRMRRPSRTERATYSIIHVANLVLAQRGCAWISNVSASEPYGREPARTVLDHSDLLADLANDLQPPFVALGHGVHLPFESRRGVRHEVKSSAVFAHVSHEMRPSLLGLFEHVFLDLEPSVKHGLQESTQRL